MSNINTAERAAQLKKLMGKGWTGKLMELTGLSRPAVFVMVQTVNTSHDHWHHVMALARKGKLTNEEIEELTQNVAA